MNEVIPVDALNVLIVTVSINNENRIKTTVKIHLITKLLFSGLGNLSFSFISCEFSMQVCIKFNIAIIKIILPGKKT
jgi:hypothetical protein